MDWKQRVVMERGKTLPFADLPPRSVALDGYVQGPQFDAANRRFSFDHHAGCVRHATLSTCEMALDAVRVGLDPVDLTLYVNDLDADTVLATWLLLRPEAALNDQVAGAVRAVGRLDALGPAVGGPGVLPSLAWALAPLDEASRSGVLRRADDWRPQWEQVLTACLQALDLWHAAGAPAQSPLFPPPPLPVADYTLLHDCGSWQMVSAPVGIAVFQTLYAKGARAAVACCPLADGTTAYTVGKASEFVAGFDVPAILRALAQAELEVHPQQSAAHNWGGGSTIGGSPRNPDGSASRLTPKEVAQVVAQVLQDIGSGGV